MTPESYMKRYHGSLDSEDALEDFVCPLATEKNYSAREEQAVRSARSAGRPCRHDRQDDCDEPMANALQLLGGSTLSSLVDFDAFFFLTDSLAIGSPLGDSQEDETDNISAPSASLRRFSPSNCELLDVAGVAYFAVAGTDDVALDPVQQINLPTVEAIAFGLVDLECELECPDSLFRLAARALRRAIREAGGETGSNGGRYRNNGGILEELSTRNLSRSVTLTVGSLVLRNVTFIGSLDGILILGDEDLERFYFVRAEDVETLG